MKLKKILPVLLIVLVLAFFFMPDKANTTEVLLPAATDSAEIISLETAAPEAASEEAAPADAGEAAQTAEAAEDTEPPAEADAEAKQSLDKDGTYTSKDDVALYIHIYGCLPQNFVTKKEAEAAGWSGGPVEKYLPGKCIGGSYFGNKEGLLPDAPGRKWTECDINTLGAKSRGAERIVFSNDGLIYYTGDHYESFELLYD